MGNYVVRIEEKNQINFVVIVDYATAMLQLCYSYATAMLQLLNKKMFIVNR